jgi:hypothetical protein
VFWIVDNGSSHRGAASITPMTHAWPNAHLIHLPRHASWLDQAEIYFSAVQRKALTPNDFTSLDQIRDRLAGFEARYNAIATPFSWKFTRADLDDLLHRIDAHDNAQSAAWQRDHPRRTNGGDHLVRQQLDQAGQGEFDDDEEDQAAPGRDGESFRVSQHGCHVGYARNVAELERWIDLADIEEASSRARIVALAHAWRADARRGGLLPGLTVLAEPGEPGT